MGDLAERYFLGPAAAFVRGRRPDAPLAGDARVVAWGLEQEDLKLHKFKRKRPLPRVTRVIGALRGFQPRSLVDIGSGRGTFLWPMMDALPNLAVTSIETHPVRIRDLRAVRDGGIQRLTVRDEDASETQLPDDHADVVTVLEVLEHQTHPERLAHQALRLAKTWVVASVPSQPDDNPEHIQLFTPQTLRALFVGAARVDIEHVRGHLIAIAQSPEAHFVRTPVAGTPPAGPPPTEEEVP